MKDTGLEHQIMKDKIQNGHKIRKDTGLAWMIGQKRYSNFTKDKGLEWKYCQKE